MTLREFLRLFYHYDSNVKDVKIIGITGEVKKLLSNNSNVLVSSIVAPIQQIYENSELCDYEVSEAGIENDQTIFVKLC